MPGPTAIPPSPLAAALDELVLAVAPYEGADSLAVVAAEGPPWEDQADALLAAARKVLAARELAPLMGVMAETNGIVPLASTADHLHVSWLALAASPGTAGVAFRFGSTLGLVNGSPPAPVASPVLIGSPEDLRRVGKVTRDVFNAAANGAG